MFGVFISAIILVAATASTLAQEGPPLLGPPIDCKLGINCWIQSYPDVDQSALAKDYTCGAATYDAHAGTDFRVLSVSAARSDVAVLASAPGTVKSLRDGEADQLVTRGGKKLVAGKECGNGILLQHAGGWETQYCHLRRGSVRVKPGDAVERGEVLGAVGFSGLAQFPHVHLAVRQRGQDIDPFTGQPLHRGCGRSTGSSLWTPDMRTLMTYRASEIIQTGFAAAPVSIEALETGTMLRVPARDTPIVLFSRGINLLKGDHYRLRLTGPSGIIAERELDPLERNKAQYVAYIGKKAPVAGWNPGVYQGMVEVIRDGHLYMSEAEEFRLE
jgi:hypothetical protein